MNHNVYSTQKFVQYINTHFCSLIRQQKIGFPLDCTSITQAIFRNTLVCSKMADLKKRGELEKNLFADFTDFD